MLAWGGFLTPYEPAWRAAACPSRRSEPAARLRHLWAFFNDLGSTQFAPDVAWRILGLENPGAASAVPGVQTLTGMRIVPSTYPMRSD
jgi:hypothetical protein